MADTCEGVRILEGLRKQIFEEDMNVCMFIIEIAQT